MPTFNHTVAKEVANGGFAQKVPSPTNPGSNQAASLYSAVHAVSLPVDFNTTAKAFFLPKGAFIEEVRIILTTALAGATSPTIKAGASAGGSEVLPSTTLAAGAFNPVTPTLAANGQVLNVTFNFGGATAGAGFLVVKYFNTL